MQKRGGNQPRTVQDIRRALEDRNLDAISIAAPNHWHSLMTIWAAQAGKHVYVEKPLSHNVKEGRIAMEMARKHNVIVQHGTQSRSSQALGQRRRSHQVRQAWPAADLARPGLQTARQHRHQAQRRRRPRKSISICGLDRHQQQPFHANLVHYNWHWFWDFGNGDIGNQGVHQMDIARWAIPGATLPRSVVTVGGRWGYTDQGQTPNTELTVFDFGETKLIFEVRGLPDRTVSRPGSAAIPSISKKASSPATTASTRAAATRPHPCPASKPHGPAKATTSPISSPPSARNASRTSTPTSSKATIPPPSATWATSPIASVKTAPMTPRTRAFGDDKDAAETVGRMEEHLRANNLKLQDLRLRAGPRLQFDAQAERFVNNEEANRLLTRNYREGFAVPDRVS